ncbi:alpha/beta-hydrolase [Panus rudis PR-1116 ss-1]|nr:alpha/beta-hydrolase [Panus rudis PR-1116 ss-1]
MQTVNKSHALEADAFRDIPYTPSGNPDTDRFHLFDLYVPKSPSGHSGTPGNDATRKPPLICFVHGGAWRSEDKADHEDLARHLVASTAFPVAIPNYRLTKPETPYKHPAHAQDTLAFLEFVLGWSGPGGTPPYDPTRLFLIGHSCSAHMLTSIFLSPPPHNPPHDPPHPDPLTPSDKLLKAPQGIILSEGIYDIDLLLESFPAYKDWFIANTFGDLPSYAAFDTTTYRLRKPDEQNHIAWFVIHSKGDQLVDVLQSQNFYQHVGELTGGDRLRWDESLNSGHNDTLKEDAYVKMVAKFVKDVLNGDV